MHAVVEAPTPQNDEQVLVEQTINSYLHQDFGRSIQGGKRTSDARRRLAFSRLISPP